MVLLTIGGIRGGDFKKSTRPINLLDASRHVKNIVHSDIVLNTPFAIIRTLFSNSFKKTDYKDVNQNKKIADLFKYCYYSNTEGNKLALNLAKTYYQTALTHANPENIDDLYIEIKINQDILSNL